MGKIDPHMQDDTATYFEDAGTQPPSLGALLVNQGVKSEVGGMSEKQAQNFLKNLIERCGYTPKSDAVDDLIDEVNTMVIQSIECLNTVKSAVFRDNVA